MMIWRPFFCCNGKMAIENLELWNLLRNKKRDQIKKLYEIAKIVLG